MRKWLASRLLRTILLSLLVVALAPLGIIAQLTLQSYETTRSETVDRSKTELNEKSLEGLQGRTLALADTIANFLRENESNLGVLTRLPRTQDAYLAFAQGKQSQIWTVNSSGKEIKFLMPSFREIAYIDSNGQEKLKISNSCSEYPYNCEVIASTDLKDVSKPENTLLKSENYFSETMALKEGAFYVSQVLGDYIPYEQAYAGAQNREGKRYRGTLRFAQQVKDEQGKTGIVTLAVEALPMLELTGHVSPANTKLQAEIDPRETDFAYVVDPQGWVISHPRHFNITGVDAAGQRVTSISEANRADPNNLFRPGNLSNMGFIDPQFPKLVEADQRGEAGTVSVSPFGVAERVLSYAPIPYYGGQYNSPAGFGLIILSTDGARFSLPAQLISKQISNRISDLSMRIRWLGIGALVIAILLALLLARSIAFPILDVTESASKIESGQWDDSLLTKLAARKGGDEISRLSRVFSSMADEVHSREQKLQARVQELEIFIDETRREKELSEIVDTDFFADLTEKAKRMRAERNNPRARSQTTGLEEAPAND
jgi:hypothetical protein